MNNTRKDLLNHVKATVEQLEKAKDYSDIKPLDVIFRSKLVNGKLQLDNITLTVTTGGPKIDVDLGNNHVHGYWSGKEVHYPILEKEEKARSTIKQLWKQYSMLYINQQDTSIPNK